MSKIVSADSKIEIIPAMDLINGACVRLSQGDYDQCKVYSNSPLEMAKRFEDSGYRRIHIVDLDGARLGKVVNLRILEEVATKTNLIIDFGGGVKTEQDVDMLFNSGTDMVCIGSLVQRNPELCMTWSDKYGKDRLVFGVDVLNQQVCIDGWKTITDTTITELVDLYGDKIANLMCTDISKDGMLEGVNVELYQQLLTRYPSLSIIASGGVSNVNDLEQLEAAGIRQAIVGKAFYEGIFNF